MKKEKKELIQYWKTTKLVTDKRVIKAFEEVERENFILKKYKDEVYGDYPLPIYEGQTISQPTTVAMMLEFLEVKKDSKVLEIGTGSGYNAALLSKLTRNKVVTIERIRKLVNFAKKNLKKAGIKNVKVIYGDGTKGYKKEAPYDRIIATCGAKEIPKAWKEQLAEGGIIVAPIGNLEQVMVIARKTKGKLTYQKKGEFRFVPLITGKG
ncbi:protein-L-isoaspartate O-methyltransferase [Candidatus Woesearchaeota archaeon]|nr:MAG: protein-L-isoaspartate O-methyltransferase [Candidatus Woesearchaeota archaeon]